MEIELNRSEQKLQGASSSYKALSGHDRAILYSMIMEPTVSQIVPRGFPKDRFLDEISQRGWARTVEVEPEMTANGAFRCWQITDKGSKRLPTYLLAISTAKITKEMAANSTAVLIKFLLKFSICYLALLVLFAALGFTATKLQINLTGTGGYLSLAVATVSLFGALYFSSRLWVFKKSEDKRLQNIAYGQFIREKTKIVSILLAVSFLVIHGSVDLLTVAIGLKAELGAPLRLLIQSALLSVLAMIFLPGILDKRLKQQVKKRAAAL